MRATERPKVDYDRGELEPVLVDDVVSSPAAASSTSTSRRLSVDPTALPTWQIRPVAVNSGARIPETEDPPRWTRPRSPAWWET